MVSKIVSWTASRSLGVACKVVGFALVFSSASSTAWAVDVVPEMDPAAMSGALTMLAGGALMLWDRCPRK